VSTHSATVLRVEGPDGPYAVVQRADPVIWLSGELMEDIAQVGRVRIRGDMELDGDYVRFGTEGEGLGRLTYRLIEHDLQRDLYVAKREP
jgi:hypothetical protein